MNLQLDSRSAALLAVRQLLDGVVQHWELDDPTSGVVGIVPVVGGVFIHPLTHEPIPRLLIYGASAGLVKIAEPRFLSSLSLVPVAGLATPTQFCALVVKLLSERLKELARVREYAAAAGVRLELEKDILRLRGCVKLQGLEIELLASNAGALTVIALSNHSVSGIISRNDRSLVLSGEPIADRNALARLVSAIEERVYAALPPTNEAGSSEVVELTEALDQEESYAPIPLREILDKLGTDTKVSAVGGRLRLEFSLKVIQGIYTFYLNQQGPKQFAGFLVTQRGERHPIEIDLNGIMDVKEVFDRVVLGKTV